MTSAHEPRWVTELVWTVVREAAAREGGQRMAHLTDEEKLAWMTETFDLVGAAVAPLAERLTREGLCAGCVTRAMAAALLQQAAWFTVLAAELSAQPAEVCHGMVSGFEKTVGEALAQVKPGVGSGVH